MSFALSWSKSSIPWHSSWLMPFSIRSSTFILAIWLMPAPLQNPSKEPIFPYPTGPHLSILTWPTSPAMSFAPR